jgi:hypothetical protein
MEENGSINRAGSASSDCTPLASTTVHPRRRGPIGPGRRHRATGHRRRDIGATEGARHPRRNPRPLPSDGQDGGQDTSARPDGFGTVGRDALKHPGGCAARRIRRQHVDDDARAAPLYFSSECPVPPSHAASDGHREAGTPSSTDRPGVLSRPPPHGSRILASPTPPRTRMRPVPGSKYSA